MTKAGTLPTSASMILAVGLLLTWGLLADVRPALAQGDCVLPPGANPPAEPHVTAQQVEEGSASLMDFTLAGRDQFSRGSATPEDVFYFGCLTRQEGSPWRSGSTFFVLLLPDGRVFLHTKDMALVGRQLNPLIYGAILLAVGINPSDLANPATFLTAFAAAAGDGGAFDIPDVPGASGYATVYFSANFGLPIVLLGGFELDASHLIQEEIDYGDPDITAGEVVDRESLEAFVTQAGEFIIDFQKGGDLSASSKLRIALRDENRALETRFRLPLHPGSHQQHNSISRRGSGQLRTASAGSDRQGRRYRRAHSPPGHRGGEKQPGRRLRGVFLRRSHGRHRQR